MEKGGALFEIFLAATGIQIFYLILFLLKLRVQKIGSPQTPEPVSVVVCGRNELENLRELIPVLLEQDYSSLEIVVVDDRSFDGSYDFIMNYASHDPRVRLVHIDETPSDFDHKKYALTLAMKAASYDRIILTDADCRPTSRNWIRQMASGFNDGKQITLGYSGYAKRGGLLNQFIRFDTLLTGMLYLSGAACGIPYMGVGRNMAYRKSFFMARKGFNGYLRHIGGDDDLFVNKNGTGHNTGICVGPNSFVVSAPKTKWRDFFRQKIRHLSAGREYRFFSRLFPGFFILSQMAFWISALILLGLHLLPMIVGGVMLIRLVILWITCSVCATRLGDRNMVLVPLLDFLYVIYYLSTAPVALLTKKVQWKN